MALSNAEFWNIGNVKSFNGYDVNNGQIDMSTSEFIDYLDEIYEEVDVCGYKYSAGQTLKDCDPVAFRCAMGDHESYLQSELEDQLSREDSSGIEWVDDEELDEDEESDQE